MSPVQKNGFVVIGAGLPRTGTLSLKTALEQVLDGPCYHMMPFIYKGNHEDTQHWLDALNAKLKGKDLLSNACLRDEL